MCGLGDMKWFITLTLVCVARIAEGVALRCSPGQDACATEQQHIELLRPAQVARSPALDGAEVGCLAGTEWESQCHRCHCSPAGRAECTRLPNCQGSSIEPLQCKPNTTFHRDCNTCLCLDSGLVLCTIESCSSRVPVHKKSELVSGRECAPGSFWRSQCNSCHCSAEGYALCTEIGCIGQAHERELRCAPNTMWKNECNTCSCTADGRALCTKMGCGIFPNYSEIVKPANDTLLRRVRASPQEPPKTCLPGTEFRLDCNKCLCDNEGQEFSCTRIDCAALNNNNNNGAARTKRDAPVKEVEGCTPGSVFDLKCNVCRCSADGGHAVCTSKPCEQPKVDDTTVEESNFRCSPGEQFVRECNDCTCSADGKSYFCTLRLCDDQISDELLGE